MDFVQKKQMTDYIHGNQFIATSRPTSIIFGPNAKMYLDRIQSESVSGHTNQSTQYVWPIKYNFTTCFPLSHPYSQDPQRLLSPSILPAFSVSVCDFPTPALFVSGALAVLSPQPCLPLPEPIALVEEVVETA